MVRETVENAVKRISHIAGYAALLAVISFPSIFFGLSYEYRAGALKAEAEITGHLISSIITTNPKSWLLQADRLKEIIGNRSRNDESYHRHILDAEGKRFIESGSEPPSPYIKRGRDLFESGVKVGRIEIVSSLRPLFMDTGLMAVAGLLLGGVIFISFRILPLRTLSRASEDLARAKETAEFTSEIAKAVGSTLEPKELFRTITYEIRHAVPCDHILIAKIFPNKKKYHYYFEHTDNHIEMSPQNYQRRGRISGTVYETKQIHNIPDTFEPPWDKTRYAKSGLRSVLVVPILQDNQCTAHALLASTKTAFFSVAHEKLLASIASHLGPAIRNASLLSESKEHTQRLAALNELSQKISQNLRLEEILESIARASMELTRADKSRIFLIDETTEAFNLCSSYGQIPDEGVLSFKAGQGVIGTMANNGKAFIIPDLQKDTRFVNSEWARKYDLHSYIAVPIQHRGNPSIIINCISRERDFFDEEDLKLLSALASQASIAIEKARLIEEIRDHAAHLELTAKIAKTIGSTLEPETLFCTIAKEIRRAVTCDRFVIATVDKNSKRHHYWHLDSNINVRKPTAEESASQAEHFYHELYEPKQLTNIPEMGEEHLSWAAHLQEAGLKSHLSVPILQDDQCVAHIAISSVQSHAFSKDDEALLTAISSHLGVAIQNARLHDEAQRSRNFFRSVIADNADAIMVVDSNGQIIQWNAGAEKLFGYSETEILGKSIQKLLPEDQRHTIDSRRKEIYGEGKTFHFEGDRQRKDGSMVPVSVTISPVKEENGNVIASCAIYKDLTEQNRVEEALRQSEERFRNLVEYAADAIFVLDLNGRFVDANQRACESLGYERDELLTLSVADVEIGVDSAEALERMKQCPVGEIIALQGTHLRKDGTAFPVDVRIGKFGLEGKELVVALARDVSDRVENESKLMSALGEAEAASQAKSEFLSTMSHELRSPLNAVIGFSDLLLRDAKEEMTLHLAPKIRDAGKYLLSMIEEILDLDRIEAGKVHLKKKPTSINDLVSGVVNSWHPRLPDGFSLSLKMDPACGVIPCDPTRIGQILNNLIDNAVKYSPEGGAIAVQTQARGDEVWVSTSDEGMGVKEEAKQSIFERFHQLENGFNRRAGGLGIGLALVHELIEMHEGRIWVDSEEEAGSTFTFALPKEGGKSIAPPGEDHRKKTLASTEDPWSGRTLLIVDDVEHYHEFMKLLTKSASRIESAYNGQEGIEAARHHRPELILMDLRMPVMDGFEAIRRLKSDPATAEIPILAVTAQAMPQDKQRAYQEGADGFVTKPIEIAAFKSEVGRVLGTRV